MPSEADFWRFLTEQYDASCEDALALDKHDNEWLDTIRIMSDWFRDEGDPRADGYLAIGSLRLRPHKGVDYSWYNVSFYPDGNNDPRSDLPSSWFKNLSGFVKPWPHRDLPAIRCRPYTSLKNSLDAAAFAWNKMGPIQKGRLMAFVKSGVWMASQKYNKSCRWLSTWGKAEDYNLIESSYKLYASEKTKTNN